MRKIACTYIRAPGPYPPSPPPDFQSVIVRSPGESASSQSDEDIKDLDLTPDAPLVAGLMPTLGHITSNDLKLMHHWSTLTWKSLGVGSPAMDAVFEWTLPNLAFDNEFLMNGVLGIASLHMQRMLPDPTQARKQTDLYRVKAVQSFREALPNIDVHSSAYEAALLMAIFLLILTAKDYENYGELRVINWLVLFRGLQTLMQMSTYQNIMHTKVAGVFTRELTPLKSPPVIPTILVDMMASIDPMDPDYEGLECYCKALDVMGPLFTCLREDGLGATLYVRSIAWPTYLSDDFLAYAKKKRPQALVILSYYLSFLKLMKGVWWIEGFSDPDIDAISHIVGPKWRRFMKVPLRIRNMSDVNEMASFLLQ